MSLLLCSALWHGKVAARGHTGAGQQVGDPFRVPAIAAGGFHSLALCVGRNNSAPTISSTTLTRTAGSPASNSHIATVNDAEDAKNTLAVTATPVTGTGLTLSNLSVDSTGNVTADVVASCSATASTFTLRVTDSGALFAEATLTVSVNANTPPTLTYASNPGNV